MGIKNSCTIVSCFGMARPFGGGVESCKHLFLACLAGLGREWAWIGYLGVAVNEHLPLRKGTVRGVLLGFLVGQSLDESYWVDTQPPSSFRRFKGMI